MKISVKAFITAKSEYDSITKCKDSFSLDIKKGIFAVSDGVSGSLMAKLWAPMLTKTFVNNPQPFFVNDSCGNKILNPDLTLPERFSKELENYMSFLDEEKKERVSRQIDRYEATGGSRGTFIGLQIIGQNAVVDTVGDSIIYTIFNDEVKYCTSMEENGEIQFTQTPQCIASNGKIYGTLKNANIPLKDGYVYLMTDGIAKWFYNPDKFKENVDLINSLKDHRDFYSFVETQRNKLSMDDDDTTLVVLKITESNVEGVEIEETYVDNVDSIELEELRLRNKKISKENEEMNDKIFDLTKEKDQLVKERDRLKDKINQIQKVNKELVNYQNKLNSIINEEVL